MFGWILRVAFVVLYSTSIAIFRIAEADLKKFLERNTAITDEKSLNEFKAVVRKNMHLTLIQIGVVLANISIIGVFLWLTGGRDALLLTIFAFVFGSFGVSVGKLEKKAKTLTCANRSLENRYKEISRIWSKNALPNF